MAYNRIYNLISFNPTTAILYVSVDLYDDATLIDTVDSFPIKLPIDANGNVPTGTELTNYLDFVVGAVYNDKIMDEKTFLAENGGEVANASEIQALTADIEPLSENIIYAGSGIPVLLVPIGGSSNFSASVLIPLADYVAPEVDVNRSRLPTPDTVVNGVYGLDNGNVNGASIIDIRGAGDTQSPFVSLDPISWDYTSVPQEVIDAWPYVARTEYFETLSYFYITHDPISIVGNYAIGVFLYS